MKANRLIRDIHHWGAIIVALPLIIMIGAGVLLMLKKQIDWIQPPSQRGEGLEVASDGSFEAQSLHTLFEAAQSARPQSFKSWESLERVDIKPGRDIVKFVSEDRWEVQIDLATADILQLSYRRSDLIESIHDGSFFGRWSKLWIFLPAGLLLFGLWVTGMWMFFLPYYKKWQKGQRKA